MDQEFNIHNLPEEGREVFSVLSDLLNIHLGFIVPGYEDGKVLMFDPEIALNSLLTSSTATFGDKGCSPSEEASARAFIYLNTEGPWWIPVDFTEYTL